MAKKTTKAADTTAEIVAVQGIAAETATPVFTPCNQCGNPGDCARAAKCRKGFK